ARLVQTHGASVSRRINGERGRAIYAARLERPRLALIRERELEDLPQPLAQRARVHRRDRLDAGGEVAGHPVGGTDVERAAEGILAGVLEVVDARVLEEPPHNRGDADVVGEARYARRERADAAHHEVRANTGLRGADERADDRVVF